MVEREILKRAADFSGRFRTVARALPPTGCPLR